MSRLKTWFVLVMLFVIVAGCLAPGIIAVWGPVWEAL